MESGHQKVRPATSFVGQSDGPRSASDSARRSSGRTAVTLASAAIRMIGERRRRLVDSRQPRATRLGAITEQGLANLFRLGTFAFIGKRSRMPSIAPARLALGRELNDIVVFKDLPDALLKVRYHLVQEMVAGDPLSLFEIVPLPANRAHGHFTIGI